MRKATGKLAFNFVAIATSFMKVWRSVLFWLRDCKREECDISIRHFDKSEIEFVISWLRIYLRWSTPEGDVVGDGSVVSAFQQSVHCEIGGFEKDGDQRRDVVIGLVGVTAADGCCQSHNGGEQDNATVSRMHRFKFSGIMSAQR